jgi:integrase
MSDAEPPDGVPIVHDIDRNHLNRLQIEDYRDHRQRVLSWLAREGKSPSEAKGYSESVVENTAYRLSRIHRWVWENVGYTATLTHDHADAFVDWIRHKDWSDENKNQYTKALKRYFAWRTEEQGVDEWEPDETYTPTQTAHHARDYLSLDERQQIRDAALEYASIPSYDYVSAAERDRWKAHLAQRFEKPKSSVTRDDWEKAISWKVPSLVSTGLDAGLRPIEVERAKVSWVDVQNAVLRIPKEDDSKDTSGGENWTVSLREDTARHLQRWLDERATRSRYNDTDCLWLTSHENPYGSDSLNYLLGKLCDEAGIETENRDISWYSVRHSTGTYMSREEGLKAAASQLRHRSTRSTMIYDQAPPEDRRDALDRM